MISVSLYENSLLYTLDMNNSVFSPDGNLLAAGVEDGVVVWRVSDGAVLQTLKSTGKASVVEFSPDSQLLASWERDSGIRLWRISDGHLLTTLKVDFPDSTFVNTEEFAQHLYFSPDGKILVAFIDNVIWSDDSILFWQVESGELLRTVVIRSEWNYAFGVRFNPEGKLLIFQRETDPHKPLARYLYPDMVILELEP